MTELQGKIRAVEKEIFDNEAILGELEEKLEVLMAFSEQCRKKSESFFASVQRRRNKLSSISHLIHSVKAIAAYNEGMRDLLNGDNYNLAKSSVEAMSEKTEAKKKSLVEDIENTEKTIKQLKTELAALKSEYYEKMKESDNGEV